MTFASTVRERINKYKAEVSVRVSGDSKSYRVVGDERIPEDLKLQRVTGILNIIEKEGLRLWAMNQALDYVRENIVSLPSPDFKGGTVMLPINYGKQLDDLLEQAAKAHEEKRDTAADYGTEAHALLEHLIINTDTAVPSKFQPVVDAWTEWLDTSDLEIVGTEVPLYYNVGGIAYAGTCDVLAVDKDDNFVICDYKTGKHMYREYPLQMAAYAMALEFCIDVPVTSKVRAFIVKLPKEEGTDPEIREVAHLAEQQDTFIDACKLKLWSSRRDKLLPKRKKSAVRP